MKLNKKKKFINNKFLHTAVISTFFTFLSKIFTVLSTILIFRLLSISEAGYYFYLLSIFSMLASVVQFGHGYALIDYFSNKEIKKYSEILLYRFVSSLVVFAVAVTFVLIDHKEVDLIFASLIIFLSIFASSITFDSWMRAKKMYFKITLNTFLASLFACIILFSIILLNLNFSRIILASLVFFISTLQLNIYSLFYSEARKLLIDSLKYITSNIQKVHKFLYSSIISNLKFSFLSFTITFYMSADLIFLKHLVGMDALGFFAGFFRIIFIFVAFQSINDYIFYSFIKRNKVTIYQGLFSPIIFGLCGFVILNFFPQYLSLIIFDLTSDIAINIMKSGSLLPLIILLAFYQNTLLNLKVKKLKFLNLIFIVVSILIILIGFTLLKNYEILNMEKILNFIYLKWIIINITYFLAQIFTLKNKSL